MSDDPECRPGQVIRHLLRRGFDRENEARSAVFGVARVFLPSISEDALVRMIERENLYEAAGAPNCYPSRVHSYPEPDQQIKLEMLVDDLEGRGLSALAICTTVYEASRVFLLPPINEDDLYHFLRRFRPWLFRRPRPTLSERERLRWFILQLKRRRFNREAIDRVSHAVASVFLPSICEHELELLMLARGRSHFLDELGIDEEQAKLKLNRVKSSLKHCGLRSEEMRKSS